MTRALAIRKLAVTPEETKAYNKAYYQANSDSFRTIPMFFLVLLNTSRHITP